MTADAKIGLLLALIFIIAIAFVINGLPVFNKSMQQDEPQKDYFSKYKDSEPGLVGSVRKIAPVLNRTIYLDRNAHTPAEKQPEAKNYQAILPTANEVLETTGDKSESLDVVVVPIAAKSVPVEISPKKYVVQKGDSLAGIAKKFYGDELGNKLANVEKIFKANSKILKSIDELSIGQELIIPFLASSETGTKTPPSVIAGSDKSTEFLEYTVEEDDSLWYIAEKFLGNGARYKEIVKLNSSIIRDENNLTVGMRLRLPKQQ